MAAVRVLLLFLLLLLPSLSFSLSENEALLKLKQSFTHADKLSSWLPDSSPCSAKWVGIICFNGIVTGLHLTGLDISGKIDIEALNALHGLRTISLINNSFSGPIPDFHRVGALKSLLLTGNQFSGEIPKDFFTHITSLKKFWISYNQFNGTIPESVTQLSHLIELHLEHNHFSGPIPPMNIPTLKQLDLSNNKLEGEIPESLSIFSVDTFKGNEGLCGKPLDKVCIGNNNNNNNDTNTNVSNQVPPQKKTNNLVVTVVVGIAVLVFVTFAYFTCKQRSEEEDHFGVLGREKVPDSVSVVEVHVPSSTSHRSRASETSRKGSSRKGSTHGKNGMSDLVMLNDDRGAFGLQDLMRAAAEVLGNGGLGSAYKAVMATGLSVVVKRLREMNRLQKDGFDAEMRRFGRLRHRNILTPLAYHFRREEKLLVSEYIPKGSLLYVLHGDRGISHAELNWPIRLKIIQGMARGMGFLHNEFSSYELPHGNLKSSNVLLGDDYEPLLSDYGFHPLINTPNAVQSMFAYKAPEFIQYQEVSPKSDVYCLGIVILEILTGKFPSQYLSNGKGGIDVVQWVLTSMYERREDELIDPELLSYTNSRNQIMQLLRIGAACTESNPEQRLDMREAIRRIEEVQI
ncbi:hypothetical protein ACJW30_07G008900 [Castanea mollissima]